MFNFLQAGLARMGNELGWPKTKEEVKDRIKNLIENIPKQWFKKAFESLPARWSECLKRRGEMTDLYIGKND